MHAAAGVWSVVTIVPSGYREFCYNVDGRFAVSKKHPTNNDGSCNWRTVYGPPAASTGPEEIKSTHHWFVEFAVNIADSIQRISPLPLHYESSDDSDREGEAAPLLRRSGRSSKRNHGSYYADVEVASARRLPRPMRKKQNATWLDKPLRISITIITIYATITLVYIVSKYLLSVS